MDNNYNDQRKLAFVNFLLELPSFIAILVSVVLTNSLIMFLDLIDSFSNVLKELFVTLISRKLQGNLKYEYNFGVSKIEAMSSLCCDAILLAGILLAAVAGVYQIINPVPVSKLIIYALIIKVINVSVDVWILFRQRSIYLANMTPVSAAEYTSIKKNLALDSGVLVAVLASALFISRPFAVYISPVMTICIGLFFVPEILKRVRNSVSELTEKTLDEEHQMAILKSLSAHIDRYDKFIAVNSKQTGNTLHIEFNLSFAGGTTYEEIRSLQSVLNEELSEEFRGEDGTSEVDVSIVIGNPGE